MIAVEISDGLGNQMYQYALYRTLLERGRNAKMQLFFYERQNNKKMLERKYELHDVFNVRERFISRTGYKLMREACKIKLMKKYFDRHECFEPEMLEVKHGLIYGHWQSFRYSQEIESIIRREFTFKRPVYGRYAGLLDEIQKCSSVSISVRRTDYLNVGYVLPLHYYERAVRFMKEYVPGAKFFCISDDIEWCINTFGRDINFVDCPPGNDAYDMQVISLCKHNITANSTFSVWGAWLNTNPGKIVIRPSKFAFNMDSRKDFYPDEWIVMES